MLLASAAGPAEGPAGKGPAALPFTVPAAGMRGEAGGARLGASGAGANRPGPAGPGPRTAAEAGGL